MIVIKKKMAIFNFNSRINSKEVNYKSLIKLYPAHLLKYPKNKIKYNIELNFRYKRTTSQLVYRSRWKPAHYKQTHPNNPSALRKEREKVKDNKNTL